MSTAQQQFDDMPDPLYVASPSRLLSFLDCPRRYRMQYLDRPRPQARPPRAHTSMGIAVHNALRDWWDLPEAERTPEGGARLVRSAWIDVGFRDADQSRRWRSRAQEQVRDYLRSVDAGRQPRGVERTVSMTTGQLGFFGRVDRLDDRDGNLVVVDYKTGRQAATDEDARTSLALALYAAAVWKMFRRRCLDVELHHVPSATIARHRHSPESLRRKVDEALSIVSDARRADRDHEEVGVESALFPPRVGALCRWCDFRAHCPEGQAVGPEKSDWAGLPAVEADQAE